MTGLLVSFTPFFDILVIYCVLDQFILDISGHQLSLGMEKGHVRSFLVSSPLLFEIIAVWINLFF